MKKNPIIRNLAVLSSLVLASQSDAAIVLQVDLEGDSGSPITETGWVSLIATTAGPINGSISTAEAGVNATLTPTGAAGIFAGRGGSGSDRGGDLSNLTHNDVHGDLVAARNGDGGVNVQLTGLNIGDTVTFTAWHNDANGGNAGFSDGGGGNVTPTVVVGGTLISATNGALTNLSRPGSATFSGSYEDSDLAPSVISFTANASTVDLRLVSDSIFISAQPISGFTVDAVPEPSAVTLAGLLGALGLMRRRR